MTLNIKKNYSTQLFFALGHFSEGGRLSRREGEKYTLPPANPFCINLK